MAVASPSRIGHRRIAVTEQPNNPLHGITLERIVTELQAYFGWEALGQRIPIRCFTHDPSLASSLKFLRRTAWARSKVEALYLESMHAISQGRARSDVR